MTVKRRWLVLTSLVAVATTAAALVAASTGGASSGRASGSITVWVDAVRLAGGEAVREDASQT